ncbi:MAG: CoA transferase [Caulobacterales bacterium]|nr:CoA transferase [Caulobacterales bacterium]
MTSTPSSGPLADVRVLDLSRILAGPWATQLLGDLGAEVIKVERPGVGDDTRGWGPPFLPASGGERGDAAYYTCANWNKRSVEIDFTTTDGREIVRDLARRCDVLVENYKTGGLAKYGLDYGSLAAINPRLVYCSITGFGHTGPYADRAGYDYLIQAMGGLMSITGQPDGAPGGEPIKVGVAVADLFAGLYAANGMLAALHHARATGRGQHVDIALLDCQAAVLANQATNYFVSGQAPGRLGNAHPNIAPYQVFPTADGHVVLAVGNDSQFQSFCMVAEAPALAADPDFTTNALRVANRERLAEAISAVMRARSSARWMEELRAAKVPCGPINAVDAVFDDPQLRAREMIADAPRPDGVHVRAPACPVKMSRTAPARRSAPPSLGADTDAVLEEHLGLDAEARSALRAAGAIG